MTLHILVAGDLHLGRRSTRLPVEWAEDRRYSAAAAWESLVDEALARGIDIVALTGDVVDRENRFYEARGPLEAGLRRLEEAGIDTVAVAGNHDFDVLPRLVSLLGLERFHVLGSGGSWQRLRLERRGGVVDVDGWSFPRERVNVDPLELYSLPTHSEAPLLGLVHGDLGATRSDYAPLSRARLAARPMTAWLLGHLHRPERSVEPGPAIFYPGSPQAFDPGEAGVHGAWLLTLEGRHLAAAELIPLSSVRYETLRVELGDAADRETFDRRWSATLHEALTTAISEGGSRFELLVARLEFAGRTSMCGRLAPWLVELAQQTELARGPARARIDRVCDETQPKVDLIELAESRDALGALAGLLLALERNEPPAGLVAATLGPLQSVHYSSGYAELANDSPPDEGSTSGHLLLAGRRLLEKLLSQREQLGERQATNPAEIPEASSP